MNLKDPIAIASIVVLCLVAILAIFLLACVARRSGKAVIKERRRESVMLAVRRSLGTHYRPPSMYQTVPQDAAESVPVTATPAPNRPTSGIQTGYTPVDSYDALEEAAVAVSTPQVVIQPPTPQRVQDRISQAERPRAIRASRSREDQRRSSRENGLQPPGVNNTTTRNQPVMFSAARSQARPDTLSPRSSSSSSLPLQSRIQPNSSKREGKQRLPQGTAYPPWPTREQSESNGPLSDRRSLPSQRQRQTPSNLQERSSYPSTATQLPIFPAPPTTAPQHAETGPSSHRGPRPASDPTRPSHRAPRSQAPTQSSIPNPTRARQEEPHTALPRSLQCGVPSTQTAPWRRPSTQTSASLRQAAVVPSTPRTVSPAPRQTRVSLEVIPEEVMSTRNRLPSSPTLGSFVWEGRQQLRSGTWFDSDEERDLGVRRERLGNRK